MEEPGDSFKGNQRRAANHGMSAIPQPVWTEQDADCSGAVEKTGVAGT